MSDERAKRDEGAEAGGETPEPEVARAQEAATEGHDATADAARDDAEAGAATEAAQASEAKPVAEAAPAAGAEPPDDDGKPADDAPNRSAQDAGGAPAAAQPAGPVLDPAPPSSASARPEVIVGAAFVGGLVLAWLLKRRVG